jgi:hypothetical protein
MRVFSSNPRRLELHLADKYLAVLLEEEERKVLCYSNGKTNIQRRPEQTFLRPRSEGERDPKNARRSALFA